MKSKCQLANIRAIAGVTAYLQFVQMQIVQQVQIIQKVKCKPQLANTSGWVALCLFCTLSLNRSVPPYIPLPTVYIKSVPPCIPLPIYIKSLSRNISNSLNKSQSSLLFDQNLMPDFLNTFQEKYVSNNTNCLLHFHENLKFWQTFPHQKNKQGK